MGESVASIDAVTDLVFKVPVLLAGAPPGCVNIFYRNEQNRNCFIAKIVHTSRIPLSLCS